MLRNYFYLNRAVTELNPLLKGAVISEVFTQEKNRLYFSIGNADFPDKHLIISADQNLPFFQIKNEHFKAKKNAVNFFDSFLPDTIEKLEIAEDDRIIKISLSSSEIFYTIRGRDTNIIIKSKNSIEAFKKINGDENELIKVLANSEFLDSAYLPDFDDYDFPNIEYGKVKKSFSRIHKDIFAEARIRTGSESQSEFKNILSAIILEIYSENISVFYDENENRTFFLPNSFFRSNQTDQKESADSYLTAVNKYLTVKYKNEATSKIRNEISKHLEKELYKLSGKLNNLKKRIDEGSKEEIYKNHGNLLLANIYLLKEKQEKITVSDYVTGEEVIIRLNNKIQPKSNVDWYFGKSRDERINYAKSKELYSLTKLEYENLLNINSQFQEASTIDDLKAVKEKLNLKSDKKHGSKMEDQIKFRHFLIDDKYHVYVGRDSKSNDLLSTKFAKQNDYWFHARGLPGSHVVLRTENTKEVMPKNIIKDTAAIAAFYSKAKTAGTAPVAYTFAKFVYKKKGMEPGQVIVQKEKVILVKPEIPKSCVILEE